MMADYYEYPVFFECRSPLAGQHKKVETYFRVRRRSGGGDCGALTTVAENLYSIKFRNRKDQQEVLRKCEHVIELSNDCLVLTVRGSLEPPTSALNTASTDPLQQNSEVICGSTTPPSGDGCELHPDDDLPFPPEEGHTAGKDMKEDFSSKSCSAQFSPEEQVPDTYSSSGEVTSYIDEDLDGELCLSEENPHKVKVFDAIDEDTVVARYSLCDGLQVLVCRDDITSMEADALVNAANEDLDHSGGVAAALSRAGGPEVQRESDAIVMHNGKTPIGEVVVTTGGNLNCKKLLHAVVPVAGKSGGREGVLLERAVRNTLNLSEIMAFKSIAMPCISSGAFGVPIAVCVEATVAAIKEFGSESGRNLSRIILVDTRGEVVRAMQEACDRLILGTGTRNSTGMDADCQVDAAGPAGPAGGGVQVEVVQGTIETQQADALVSPMVHHEPLSTRVGNILNKMVGSQLTASFRKEAGEETMPGDPVLVEGLPGLPSDAVFFLSLIPWDDEEEGTAVQVLRLGINNILTSCEERGFRSVALPVLGAGIALRFPHSVVARVLMEQVGAFELEGRSSRRLLVRIVIHPSEDEAYEDFLSVQEELRVKEDQESTAKRIVLLGKTGSGKSHLANTIFGEELFTANHTPNSGTSVCQAETKCIGGKNITLIDTPGFFDTGRSEEDTRREIMNCMTECSPGPHAFLVVLNVGKFTGQEQDVVDKICQCFSEDALKHAIIVFTHGNQLTKGMKIEEFVRQNKNLSDLVDRCGGRCHVFDNRYWENNQQNNYRSNQFQLEALLRTIEEMVTENKGRHYTNGVLQNVEKEIKKQEVQIRESSGHLASWEIRKMAKQQVSNQFLIQLAGTATGALIGAFLGLVTMVDMIINTVKNPSELVKLVKKIPALGAPAAMVAGGEVALVAGVTTGAAAVTGGVLGAIVGHDAAKGAKTVSEAAGSAFQAVMEKRKATMKKQ